MQLFVAGATGVLGRRIVREAADRGHRVVGLVRDEAGAATVADRGGEPRHGDVLDRASLREAAAGADVIVHAATAIPTGLRPSEPDWETNDRVRRDGARNLLAAAEAVGADRFVLQSVVWLVRRPDGRPFDESADPNPDRSTRSAGEAERVVRERADAIDVDPVVLRCGWFYAADAAHTRRLGEGLLARRLPIIGGGPFGRRDAELSFVHVDDAARAFVAAAGGAATGTFHVADDRPTTYARFLNAFADRLEAPRPFRIPGWLARLAVGGPTVGLLTRPMPTANDAVRDAFDWRPQLETVDAGLDAVVESWIRQGTIRAVEGGHEWTAG